MKYLSLIWLFIFFIVSGAPSDFNGDCIGCLIDGHDQASSSNENLYCLETKECLNNYNACVDPIRSLGDISNCDFPITQPDKNLTILLPHLVVNEGSEAASLTLEPKQVKIVHV